MTTEPPTQCDAPDPAPDGGFEEVCIRISTLAKAHTDTSVLGLVQDISRAVDGGLLDDLLAADSLARFADEAAKTVGWAATQAGISPEQRLEIALASHAAQLHTGRLAESSPRPRPPNVQALLGDLRRTAAHAWYLTGEWAASAELSAAAAEAFTQARQPLESGRCLRNAASCLRRVHQYEAADRCYALAERELRRNGGSDLDLGRCLQDRGACLLHLDRVAFALSMLEEAEVLIRDAGDDLDHARWRVHYANGLRQDARPSDALRQLEVAEPILRARQDDEAAALALVQKAGCLLMLGRAGKAEGLYRRARLALRRHGLLLEAAHCRVGEATCKLAAGMPEDALPIYRTAGSDLGKAVAPDEAVATCQVRQANCLVELRRHKEALVAYRKAWKYLGSKDGSLDRSVCALGIAACLHYQGRLPEAQNWYEKAALSCPPTGFGQEVLWRVQYNRARLLRRLGDRVGARRALAEAMSITDERSDVIASPNDRFTAAGEYADAYRLAADLDLEDGLYESAHQHVQRAKNRVLARLVAAGAIAPVRPSSGEGAGDVGSAEQQPGEVCEALLDGELLLDFLEVEDHVLVFALTKRGIVHTARVDRKALYQLIGEFRTQMADTFATAEASGGYYDRVTVLDELYDSLILPIRDGGHLNGIQRLLISASGRVHEIPFTALSRVAETATDQPVYLYEELEICLIPSATAVRDIRRRPTATLPPSLVAVAPFARTARGRGSRKLERLEHSAREVADVQQAFLAAYPNASTTVLLNGDATLGNAVAGARTATVLLIATHGDRHPGSMGTLLEFQLSFAPETKPPAGGRRNLLSGSDLTVADICAGELPLVSGCHVCLSGCYLGGAALSGEEATGIAHALVAAGASVCLAPAESPQDDTAAAFSISYHEALLAPGRPTASAALRHALTAVRKRREWAHPQHWAWFTAIGDGALRLP